MLMLLKNMQQKQPAQEDESPSSGQQDTQIDQKKAYRKLCIERYKNKTRSWKKKVNYDQRKLVADNRLRIQGRFISKKDHKTIDQLLGQEGVNDVFVHKKNLDV